MNFTRRNAIRERRLRLLTLRIVVACNGTLLQAVIDRIESIKHDYSQVRTRKERKRVKRNGAGQKRVARVAESKEFEVSFCTFTGGRSVSGSLCSAGRLIVLIRRHGIELRATCTRTRTKRSRERRDSRARYTRRGRFLARRAAAARAAVKFGTFIAVVLRAAFRNSASMANGVSVCEIAFTARLPNGPAILRT